MAIFDDLEAEQDRLEEILGGLDAAQWTAPSAASGWTVADVVLHLAPPAPASALAPGPAPLWTRSWMTWSGPSGKSPR